MKKFSWRLAAAMAVAVAAVWGLAATPARAATINYPGTGACAQHDGDGAASGLDMCIASASTGDTISIKKGVYNESDIAVGKQVTLQGACGGSIIDVRGGGGSDGLLIGADGVTIKCLKLRNARNIGGNGVAINDAPGAIAPHTHLTVMSVTVARSYVGVGLGSVSGGGSNLTVKSSTFIGDYAGVAYVPTAYPAADNSLISGNTFIDCNIGADLLGNHSTMTGNVATNTQAPLVLGGDGGTISKNTITSAFYGAVLESQAQSATGISLSSPAPSALAPNPPALRPLPTIGRSPAKTSRRRTTAHALVVPSTTLTLTSNKITGAQLGFAVIANGTGDDAIVATNNTATMISQVGAEVIGTTATVTGNLFPAGTADQGLVVETGGVATVSKNKIVGVGATLGLAMVCTGPCAGTVVSQNTVTGAIVPSDSQIGIGTQTNANCVADGCITISKNTVMGIWGIGIVAYGDYATLSSNTASYVGYADNGASIGVSGNHNTLTGNKVTDAANDAFVVSGDDNSLSKNTATGSSGYGFRVTSGDGNTFDGNIATGNDGDGFNNDGTSTAFTNNKASGNRQDCTSDSSESATLGTLSGNTCADGSDFAVQSTLDDADADD